MSGLSQIFNRTRITNEKAQLMSEIGHAVLDKRQYSGNVTPMQNGVSPIKSATCTFWHSHWILIWQPVRNFVIMKAIKYRKILEPLSYVVIVASFALLSAMVRQPEVPSDRDKENVVSISYEEELTAYFSGEVVNTAKVRL